MPDAHLPRTSGPGGGRGPDTPPVGRANPQQYAARPADPRYGSDPAGHGSARVYGSASVGRANPEQFGRAEPAQYGRPARRPAHEGPGGMPVSPAVPPSNVPPAPPTTARRRRLWPVAVLATVLLVVLAAIGVVVVRPGPVAGWLGSETAAPPAAARSAEPDPAAVLAGPDPNAPVPSPDGVRAAVEPLVDASALGDRVNVSVADVVTGKALFGSGQDTPTVPASVTKLATAITVLAARGPAYRIPTRAVAGEAPGEVVLVGGGDPTLAVDGDGFYPGAARLDQLAAQVRKALGGTDPTRVTVDSSLYSGPVHEPGWDSDIPVQGFGAAITALMTDGARRDPVAARKNFDETHGAAERVPQPDLTAGRQFARLLGLSGNAAEVKKGTAPAATGASAAAGAPTPGTELGKVESLPMVRLVDIMISDSDNVVAEALARQVALARGKPASFAGGAAATDAVIGELGLPADEINLADGSGLSRTNRISPSLLTDLLTLAGNGSHPELAAIFGGLPVGGWSGTLDDRYHAAVTRTGAGVVRAKTGTLTGVNALAGLVTTADGRLLTFAVLTDRTTGSLDETRQALDRITSALAGCGCP